MDLITLKNIKKNFSEKVLLTDINLIIHDTDKIGLVGINGSGKSTLLKIVAGAIESDSGETIKSNDLRVSYLPQEPIFDSNKTILEQVIFDTDGKIEEYVLKTYLNKVGIFDLNIPMGNLSGGQRKKVALVECIARDSNLLILDEPTNHLDPKMVEWLEEYLDLYKGAIFMITHDRYFLERVTDKICEIENGKLFTYEGNYDGFLEMKASRLSMEIASERKREQIYKKELRWIHWSAPARTTKAKGRIERFKKLEDSKRNFENPKLELSSITSRLGKKIIEIKGVSKSFNDKKLIDDFTYTILRNDRIGIVGTNGCGKTTLLKMILGEVVPDTGSISIGETVRIGYFSQETKIEDSDIRIIKYVEDIATNFKIVDGYISASQMLEKFLFPPHTHSTLVSKLSGGEKRRLALLSVLVKSPNVLLFDEPTNDLDIETLTVLEDYLDEFNGAVIIVSHDRYFLDRLVNRTFAFENTKVNMYNGGYSDYMNLKEEDVEKTIKIEKDSTKEKTEKLKFSYNEKREFEEIESVISKLEEKISSIEKEIKDNPNDYEKLVSLTSDKEKLEEELLIKMERWEYLSTLDEKIKKQG